MSLILQQRVVFSWFLVLGLDGKIGAEFFWQTRLYYNALPCKVRKVHAGVFYFRCMPKADNSFFERVYDVVRLIPYGRVTSYGAIARCLGSAGSSRMVGWAMNASHTRDDIPAHRVVNRNGVLTGKHHFPGTNLMQELLENEGVVIVEDQIQDFQKHFWDPVIEFGFNG
jgi:methylated-DNA-protein-cysteine methyltransferase-like protein